MRRYCQGIHRLIACVSSLELYLFVGCDPVRKRSLWRWDHKSAALLRRTSAFLFFTCLSWRKLPLGRDSEERKHFPCLISRLWGRQVVCKTAKLLGRDYHCDSFIFAISIWQLAQAFSCIRQLKSRQLSHFIKSSLHRGYNSLINFIYLACPFVAFLQMFLSSGRTREFPYYLKTGSFFKERTLMHE